MSTRHQVQGREVHRPETDVLTTEPHSQPRYKDSTAWQPGTFQVGRLVRRLGGLPRRTLKEGVERRGPRAL